MNDVKLHRLLKWFPYNEYIIKRNPSFYKKIVGLLPDKCYKKLGELPRDHMNTFIEVENDYRLDLTYEGNIYKFTDLSDRNNAIQYMFDDEGYTWRIGFIANGEFINHCSDGPACITYFSYNDKELRGFRFNGGVHSLKSWLEIVPNKLVMLWKYGEFK